MHALVLWSLAIKAPTLQLHEASGQWFTFWGGKSRYFGKNRAEAEVAYPESLQAWAAWRRTRATARKAARGTTQVVLMSACRTLELRGLNPTKTIADAVKTYLTTGELPPLPA